MLYCVFRTERGGWQLTIYRIKQSGNIIVHCCYLDSLKGSTLVLHWHQLAIISLVPDRWSYLSASGQVQVGFRNMNNWVKSNFLWFMSHLWFSFWARESPDSVSALQPEYRCKDSLVFSFEVQRMDWFTSKQMEFPPDHVVIPRF